MFHGSCLSEHDFRSSTVENSSSDPLFFVQGGIHEFADHMFAKGPNREAARHSNGEC